MDLPSLREIDYLASKKLLESSMQRSMLVRNINGTYSDPKLDKFASESKVYPPGWQYKIRKITYSLNSDYYRCPEWNDIFWEQSVVMFGCSFTFGLGVDEEETVCYFLSKLIGKPVINLGVPGTGPMYALHNQILFRKLFPIPAAVINMWSSPYRMHLFHKKDELDHVQVGQPDRVGFNKVWGESPMNPVRHCYFASKAAELIWDRTKYVSASTFPVFDPAITFIGDIENDYAADLAHFGPKSNFLLAQKLKQLLG